MQGIGGLMKKINNRNKQEEYDERLCNLMKELDERVCNLKAVIQSRQKDQQKKIVFCLR